MINATHGDRYEDDGIIFESIDFYNNNFQVRVGPVFDDNFPNGHPEQAIWMELGGTPFLMSQATFVALNNHIHRRIDEWKKFKDVINKE